MALSTLTCDKAAGFGVIAPTPQARISFAGDAAYATNGSAGFAAKVATALEAAGLKPGTLTSAQILAVVSLECGGYKAEYIHSTDKLKVYYGNYDASDGPQIEVPNATDLSAVTFNVLVLFVG